MSNDSVLAEKVYGSLVARQDKQQMAGIQDATKSVFLGDEHSSSYSYSAGLAEPAFIRRSTCSDTSCGAMTAGYIFL